MQKQLNENFYLTIQRELRNLALKSSKLTYGEYFEILLQKLKKESRGFKFLKVYLFDKQVKDSRKKMQKRYMVDFKE